MRSRQNPERIRQVPDSVTSLPATYYHDLDIFRLEQARVFRRHWTLVGREACLEQAGAYITDSLGGQSVIVLRKTDRQLAGYLNLCRHRASPLCLDEAGNTRTLVCPYHAWTYDLDGRLQAAPGFPELPDPDHFSLVPVQVDCWNGLVFACLDDRTPPLQTWLGDIVDIAADYPSPELMQFERSLESECAANWKNYSDNSAEGYHLSMVHPGLNASLVRGQTRIQAFENGAFVGFDVTYRDGEEESPGYWIYKYPGLLLHFSRNSFNCERVVPLSPGHSLTRRWFWFLDSVPGQDREQTIEFSNQVMAEDIGICSRVQENLEGGFYDTGLLSPEREPGTIFIQQCLQQDLEHE